VSLPQSLVGSAAPESNAPGDAEEAWDLFTKAHAAAVEHRQGNAKSWVEECIA
jgi:hypothetical protein